MTVEVVINNCFGGFSLSAEAIKEILKRNGKKAFFYIQTKFEHRDGRGEYKRVSAKEADKAHLFFSLTKDVGNIIKDLPEAAKYWFHDRDIARDDKDLIAVVRKFKNKANGKFAELKIVEIPDDVEYYIDEYDGNEHVAEKHRSWS